MFILNQNTVAQTQNFNSNIAITAKRLAGKEKDSKSYSIVGGLFQVGVFYTWNSTMRKYYQSIEQPKLKALNCFQKEDNRKFFYLDKEENIVLIDSFIGKDEHPNCYWESNNKIMTATIACPPRDVKARKMALAFKLSHSVEKLDTEDYSIMIEGLNLLNDSKPQVFNNKNPRLQAPIIPDNGWGLETNYKLEARDARDEFRRINASKGDNLLKYLLKNLKFGHDFTKKAGKMPIMNEHIIDETTSQIHSKTNQDAQEEKERFYSEDNRGLTYNQILLGKRGIATKQSNTRFNWNNLNFEPKRAIDDNEYELKLETKTNEIILCDYTTIKGKEKETNDKKSLLGAMRILQAQDKSIMEKNFGFNEPKLSSEQRREFYSFLETMDEIDCDFWEYDGFSIKIPSIVVGGKYVYMSKRDAEAIQHNIKAYDGQNINIDIDDIKEEDEYITHENGEEKLVAEDMTTNQYLSDTVGLLDTIEKVKSLNRLALINLIVQFDIEVSKVASLQKIRECVLEELAKRVKENK